MGVSDIITLLTVVLAILAIFNERNRKHLLLKFHKVDYLLFLLSFAFINYFIFYESFYSRNYIIKSLYFDDFGLRHPKHYAYLITLATLVYLFLKIWKSFYPYVNIDKVLRFYRVQIEQQEIGSLMDILERYHLRDIGDMMDKSPDYDADEDLLDYRFHKRTKREKFQDAYTSTVRVLISSSALNRYSYARSVLHNILNDPAFTVLSANQRPYFFASIFRHFRLAKQDAFPRDMLKTYFGEWVNKKNFWLQKELRQSQNHDSGQPEWFFDDNRILASVMLNLDVADTTQVWQPFGDAAKDEIEEERLKGYESKFYLEFREEHHLWEFRTYYSIEFFYVLLIEAIKAKYTKTHFFLHYYWYIVADITKVLDQFPPDDIELNTVYHELINQILSKNFHWLELCNKYEHPGMHHDVLGCLGSIIADICKSDSIPEKTKINAVDRLFRRYCTLEKKGQTDHIRSKIGEILLKPSMSTTPHDIYYEILEKAWEKFDKVPYQHVGGDSASFASLKATVIVPRGLDPNQY